jgi:hypothetical protein
MSWRSLAGAVSAAAVLAVAGSASAAIVLSDDEAGGTAVHSVPGQLANSVLGEIGPGGELVTLTTTTGTIATSGGGASTYTGPFSDFVIIFLTGKAIVGFNVEFYNPPGGDPTQTTGLSVYVNGNLVGTRTNPLAAPQKYTVTASGDDVINDIALFFAPNVIGSVKQIRVTDTLGGGGNEVPEPATWALMIVGFGATGAMLRRRELARVRA